MSNSEYNGQETIEFLQFCKLIEKLMPADQKQNSETETSFQKLDYSISQAAERKL